MPNPMKTQRNRPWRRESRYPLFIIQLLVFTLPLMVILYISVNSGVALKSSHRLLVALALLLVLAGTMILRQLFDRFFGLAAMVDRSGTAPQRENAEAFRRISFSLSRIMARFERATEELKRRVFELFTIRELTEATTRVLDIDDLLRTLLDKAMAVSGARLGSVFFCEHEQNRLRIVEHRGLTPGPGKNTYIRINKTVLKEVVQKQRPLLITDIAADPRTRRPSDPRYGAPSLLAMPILARSGVIAVLSLANKAGAKALASRAMRNCCRSSRPWRPAAGPHPALQRLHPR